MLIAIAGIALGIEESVAKESRGTKTLFFLGPLQVLGVFPGTAVQIVRGEENLASYGEEVVRSFCVKCGCFISSKPQDGSFVVVSPVTFQIEGPEGNNNGSCLLPSKYRAQCHINYESRTFNAVDSLPKFKVFFPFKQRRYSPFFVKGVSSSEMHSGQQGRGSRRGLCRAKTREHRGQVGQRDWFLSL